MNKVKLEDVIESIEFANDLNKFFFDKNTGKIHLITDEVEMHIDDDPEDNDFIPEWEKELVLIARDIQNNPDQYIQLPSKFEINVYAIMEKFCLSLNNENLRNEMYYSIKGSGAFRRFYENIQDFNLEKDWYKYRDEAYKEMAIEWCNDNNLEYYCK
jgi:hypothetical protein